MQGIPVLQVGLAHAEPWGDVLDSRNGKEGNRASVCVTVPSTVFIMHKLQSFTTGLEHYLCGELCLWQESQLGQTLSAKEPLTNSKHSSKLALM